MGPLGPEASGAKAPDYSDLTVGAEAPASANRNRKIFKAKGQNCDEHNRGRFRKPIDGIAGAGETCARLWRRVRLHADGRAAGPADRNAESRKRARGPGAQRALRPGDGGRLRARHRQADVRHCAVWTRRDVSACVHHRCVLGLQPAHRHQRHDYDEDALSLRVPGTRADVHVPCDDQVGGRSAAARAHCRRVAHRRARVRQRSARAIVSRHPGRLVWQETYHAAGNLCRARVSSHSRVASRARRAGRGARHRSARHCRKTRADCRRRRDSFRSLARTDRAGRSAEHSRGDHHGRQRQHCRHTSAGRRRVRALFAQGSQRHARRRGFLPRGRHES